MGFAVGLSCVRDPVAAAVAYCSAVDGTSAGGTHSCEAPSITGQTLTYTLAVDSASGRTTRAVDVVLGECEPLDLASAEPLLWLAVAGWMALLALRKVREQVFGPRE